MRVLLASVFLLFSSVGLANDCEYSAMRNLDIDAAGISALRFELTSSDIKVEGVAGLAKIEVRARACASSEAWLAELQVAQSRLGDKLVLKPQSHDAHSGMFNSYAYIDFDVRVPETLALQVDTSSGDANIAHVAALDFSSHSGDLNLEHVTGAVTVDVHSGDVVASDIGSFRVGGAGSGDISATDVRGDVNVAHVGSGDVHLRDVGGGVQIESIGSGDLQTERIKGDVVLDSIGSGDVNANHVTGSLIVKAAGSGEIHHDQIGGRVDVPKNHLDD